MIKAFYISSVFLIYITLMFSCKEENANKDNISFLCLRDNDTLHIRLTNNSNNVIYIPTKYIGTYNVDSDTIFLEVVDKPRFNRDLYYRYTNIFTFDFYTVKELPGIKPDTVMEFVNQTYYFNQFKVRPFKIIYPDSVFVESIVFNIPKGAKTAQFVYYNISFYDWLEKKNKGYFLKNFREFDSLEANYVTSELFNKY